MAIAKIIFRKMLNNRWLVGSLFLGLLITSSLVASIPTYSASVLSKLLIKELENYQIKENHYPGEYSFYLDTQKDPSINQNKFVEELDRMNDRLTQDTGMPLKTKVTVISTIPMAVSKQEDDQSTSKSQKYGSIKSLTELQKHMVLTDGRLPNSSVKDGVYEVLVTEMALQKRDMVLNKILLAGEGKKQIKIKPVGTFKAKNERDPYWFLSADSYSNDFILPETTFRDSFLKGNDRWIENIRYFTAFDYHAINMEKFNVLLALEAKTKASISEVMQKCL
jgi:putative ABC transport system permease protein